MITTAVALIIVAALMGAYLLWHVLRGKATPKGIAFIHGPVAAAGLVLLVIGALSGNRMLWIPVILFVIAAGGGVWLILTDLSGTGPSKVLAMLHGTIAVAGFLVLLYVLSQA